MYRIVINGGKKLSGQIEVRGAKNAALPLIAASLLTREKVTLRNVPRIVDVKSLLGILESMSVSVKGQEDTYEIEARDLVSENLQQEQVGKLRGSILLLGALLGREKRAILNEPGGDIIGARPIDVHFDGLSQLGAVIERKGNLILVDGKNMRAGKVVLSEFSVTATENIMMVAATLPGKTTIHIAAGEPHVVLLAEMLEKMGAKVRGAGTHTIEITGKNELAGAEVMIIPDMLEAGLLILIAAATKSEVEIQEVPVHDLELFIKKMQEIGVKLEITGENVRVFPSELKGFKVQTLPQPGIATDLQAPFAVLATQAIGASLIHDPMYESRFKHCEELVKMGARITVCDPHRVIIHGPSVLFGSHISSPDIRSGATLIMAGLAANGRTVIEGAEIMERGYEDLPGRLRKLGADIYKE